MLLLFHHSGKNKSLSDPQQETRAGMKCPPLYTPFQAFPVYYNTDPESLLFCKILSIALLSFPSFYSIYPLTAPETPST